MHNIDNLGDLLFEADIAVISFGITSYEAAAVGTPSIIICPTHYHNEMANIFIQSGTAINLGFYESVSESIIEKKVKELAIDYDLREKLALKGKKLIDGKGVKRIGKIIQQTLIKK